MTPHIDIQTISVTPHIDIQTICVISRQFVWYPGNLCDPTHRYPDNLRDPTHRYPDNLRDPTRWCLDSHCDAAQPASVLKTSVAPHFKEVSTDPLRPHWIDSLRHNSPFTEYCWVGFCCFQIYTQPRSIKSRYSTPQVNKYTFVWMIPNSLRDWFV